MIYYRSFAITEINGPAVNHADKYNMDIQSLSVDIAQNRVQEEVAVRLQSMLLKTLSEAGADLDGLIESANIITDPAKGNFLNLLM